MFFNAGRGIAFAVKQYQHKSTAAKNVLTISTDDVIFAFPCT